MARFWILSDLHQKFADNTWTPVRPDDPFDFIIAAGDIHSPLDRSLRWLREAFPRDHVVYVPGNHDFWQWGEGHDRLPIDEIERRAVDTARILGIDLLLDDRTVVAGTRVLGCTLWTDYRVTGQHSLAASMKVAERGMNDYGRIRRASSSRPTKPIRPMDLLARHQASVEFLDAEMAVAVDWPTVVVTHHAPHPRSLMTTPGDRDDLDACYASDLSWLMEKHSPALWVHGHTHVPSDYVVGSTRVVCNPRGYPGEIQHDRWRRDLVVEA